MSFIIMQHSLTYYSLGVTISFCKFWFESDTLIQVRYCHLLYIWCVFIVDILMPFLSKLSKDIRMYFSFIHTIRFNNIVIGNVSCSFLMHIKYEKHESLEETMYVTISWSIWSHFLFLLLRCHFYHFKCWW